MKGGWNSFPGARLLRLRLGGRASLERDVRDEIESHVAMRIEFLMARGMSREDAERAARQRFGDYENATRDIVRGARARENLMQRRQWLTELAHDLRLAMRTFGRAPVFTAAIVLTLGLGAGANGAVFGILRSTLLQPLPYRNPDRVAMVWREFEEAPGATNERAARRFHGLLTTALVLDWRDRLSRDVAELAAVVSWQGNLDAQFDLTLDDRVERLNGARVTPNFFEILGVTAMHGRLFTSVTSAPQAPQLVLSHALWQRHFGGDSGVVGRVVTLTGEDPRQPRAYTIIGVLPPEFRFTYPEGTDAYALMDWSVVEGEDPRHIRFTAITRLRDGVTVEQAQARASILDEDEPRSDRYPRPYLDVEPVREWVLAQVRPSLLLIGGVAALLLIVTCMTVANALLARFSLRQQELAVRTALGASRFRLVRQLLVEGGLLASAGAVVCALLTIAVQPSLQRLLPQTMPRVGDIQAESWILAFALGVAALTTILATLGPALTVSRVEGVDRLIRGARGATANRTTRRLRRGILVGQAAVSTVLLISATLLLVSLWRLHQVPLGFDGDRVVTVEMRLLDRKYRDEELRRRFQQDVLTSVRALPGVQQASLTSAVPFRGVDFMMNVGRIGDSTGTIANARFVDSAYFNVLRIPLLRGRVFSGTDVEGAPDVVVLSASLARKLFGDADPLGERIVLNEPLEVIGIVGDVRYARFEAEPFPAFYRPHGQAPSTLVCVIVRARRSASELAPEIHRAVRAADPSVPAMRLTTIDRIVDSTLASRRFYTVATTAFAIIGVLLTTIGMGMVVARGVAERRRELAIRAALGATGNQLAHWVSRDALLAVLAGVAGGLAGTYAASELLTQFMFGVTARSSTAYAAVSIGLLTTAAIAALWSARSVHRLPLALLVSSE